MNNLYNITYFDYLQKQSEQEFHMRRYIRECAILSEGVNVVDKLAVLNEEESGWFMKTWEKFKNFVIRIWNKFMENMTSLLNSDVGYLNKYKDVILKKPVKINVTMRQYNIGIQRMISTSIPLFTEDMLNGDLIKTENDDANLAFKRKFIQVYDGKEEFNDFCVDYFQGGDDEKEFSSHSINMTDLYNYCITYKSKIKPILEKDKETTLKAYNTVKTAIDKYMKDNTGYDKPNPAQQNTTKPTATTKPAEPEEGETNTTDKPESNTTK